MVSVRRSASLVTVVLMTTLSACAAVRVEQHGSAATAVTGSYARGTGWAVVDPTGDVSGSPSGPVYLPRDSIDITSVQVTFDDAARLLRISWKVNDLLRQGHSGHAQRDGRGYRTDITFQELTTRATIGTPGGSTRLSLSSTPGDRRAEVSDPTQYGPVERRWQAGATSVVDISDDTVEQTVPYRALRGVSSIRLAFDADLHTFDGTAFRDSAGPTRVFDRPAGGW